MDFSTVVSGQILPDGTLHIADALPLPPGPVRVRIESLAPVEGDFNAAPHNIVKREPGPFLLDECITAPFDLPYNGPLVRIYPQRLESYPLPEPHDLDEPGT